MRIMTHAFLNELFDVFSECRILKIAHIKLENIKGWLHSRSLKSILERPESSQTGLEQAESHSQALNGRLTIKKREEFEANLVKSVDFVETISASQLLFLGTVSLITFHLITLKLR